MESRATPHDLPPRRKRYFAGREAELEELHRLLGDHAELGVTQEAAASGNGGVGKTALAIEYAWRHFVDYPGGLFFVSCDVEEPLAAVATVARTLELSEEGGPEATLQRIRARLQAGPPSLLILDNVRGAEQWSSGWVDQLPGGTCRRLVTTRETSLPGLDQVLRLPDLSIEEGLELLSRYRDDATHPDNVEACRRIVRWFGGLAIGLTVVGAFLRDQPQVLWINYLEDLEQRGLGTVDETESALGRLPDYEQRVGAVFEDLLESLEPIERLALHYAALLPRDFIVESWLVDLLEQELEVPASLPGERCSPALRVVRSLIDRQVLQALGEQDSFLSLHRVLALVLQISMTEDHADLLPALTRLAETQLERCRDAITDRRVRVELDAMVALFYRLSELGQVGTAAMLGTGLAASALRGLGRYSEAKQVALEATELFAQEFEPDHPNLAASYSNLATVLRALGEFGEAREYLERAIQIGERHFEPDHPNLAVSYSNLALVLQELGEIEEARQYLERAIRAEEKYFVRDHPTLAVSYSNMATVLKSLGELGTARDFLQRAIRIEEKHFVPDHPNLAVSYSNMATVLQDLGELGKARDYLEGAIRIGKKHFEPDHPSLAVSYSNMATLLLDLGEIEEARRLAVDAWAIARKSFPPSHPNHGAIKSVLHGLGLDPADLQ